jgi:hypothetical protein
VGRVDVDAMSAVAIRVADSDETGGDEVIDGFTRNLPELFGPGRALLEHGNESGGPPEQLVPEHSSLSCRRRRHV